MKLREFIAELETANGTGLVARTTCGAIRLDSPQGFVCPLAWMANVRHISAFPEAFFDSGDHRAAGAALGLSSAAIVLIVDAADNRICGRWGRRTAIVRSYLLVALGCGGAV